MGGVVKAVEGGDAWELDVLGCPFGGPNGGKDSDGEYFSAATSWHADKYGLPPVVYYHGFEPDGRPAGEPAYIGRTVGREVKSDGVWYRVVLDQASDLAARVWEAAKQGLARASSGSVAHLRRVAGDGHITQWPVAELSLFDAVGRRQPANAYAVALPVVKARWVAAGLEWNGEEVAMGDERRDGAGASRVTIEDVNTVVAAALKADRAEQMAVAERAAQTKADEQARVDAAVKAARAQWEQDAAAGRRLPDGPTVPVVAKFGELWRYDHLDAGEQATLCQILDGARESGASKRGVSEVALKALAVKLGEDKSVVGVVGQQAMKAQGIKANEVMQQGLLTEGRDWVGAAYSQSAWEKIRILTFVAQNLPSIEIPQGMESMTLPLESSDPTFYKVGEAASVDSTGWPAATVPSSYATTAKKTISLAKMAARVLFSGEMEEDSLIPFVPQLQHQLTKGGAEQLEHAIIDGDIATTATTNINDIGNVGTQAATNLYLLFDGFRKNAIVTNTSNARAASGAVQLSDVLNTVQLMGVSGINALDRSKVGIIVDPLTYYALIQLTQVQTRDVFSSPTIEGGKLTGLYGFQVNPSGFIAYKGSNRTNTAGKVDQTTQANNTKGSLLAVRWDQWLLGYKRRMTTEVTRIPRADTTEIVCLMRLGLNCRDSEATALTYNLS